MSDSDEDVMPNSFLKFPREKTITHTQSSNVNKPSYGSYNNMMSNFNMPNQFMGFDQRSIYSRRKTSPVSLRSFPNSRMPFQESYSQSAMSSRGSVYNARCRSPMSVRSIDSNVSVIGVDIASAIRNSKLNKFDLRMIFEAYNSHMKNCKRRRIGKRRNLKSFIKLCRRKSGGESGVEGSDSSISSDDCRSTRSAFYTENMTRVRSRPPKVDLNKFTKQVRENYIYNDCTENFKQNPFRNTASLHSRTVNYNFRPHNNQQNVLFEHGHTEVLETCKDQCAIKEVQNAPIDTLKDRFKKDASSLPLFQRFNKSCTNPTYEISYKEKSKTVQQSDNNIRHEQSDNECDDIFPQSTSRLNLTQNNIMQHKRVLESEHNHPVRKRKKLSTSPESKNISVASKNVKKVITKSNDFKFKKPQLPVRKSASLIRGNEPEILIAKSSQPLVGNVEPISIQSKEIPPEPVINVEDTNKLTKEASEHHIDTVNSNIGSDITQNSTDVSMKPSFIKRKLFSQKLDMAENKNISSDNLNSPQTKVLRTCREKNKVRKLTSQSCLSREVPSDNNYLDLIHKIVPPEQIKNQNLNNASIANKKQVSKSSLDRDGKWDVTLAVSTCNNDTKSDTYTDEEIFNVPQKNTEKTQISKTDKRCKAGASQGEKSVISSNVKVIMHRLPETFNLKDNNNEVSNEQCQVNKRTVMSCVKSFWDTDFESDMDDPISLSSTRMLQKGQISRDSQLLPNVIAPKKKPTCIISSVGTSQYIGMNKSTRCNEQNLKAKSIMLDNIQDDKENNTDNSMLNESTHSHSKNKETDIKNIKDNKNDTANNSKSKNQKINKQEKPKPTSISSIKNKKQSESIFNISRESLRQKQKRQASIKVTTADSHNIKSVSSKCRTTRQNKHKQKKEATLNSPKDSQILRNDANVISPKKKPRGTNLPVKSFWNLDMNHSKRSDCSENRKVENKTNEQNKENNNSNIMNRSTRSRSKHNESDIENTKDTKKYSHDSELKKKRSNKLDKPEMSSRTKNKQQSQSIFNISRESLRKKQKR